MANVKAHLLPDFRYVLILIDNTAHMDRQKGGIPYLSFFRTISTAWGVPNVLIAYAEPNGKTVVTEIQQGMPLPNFNVTTLGSYYQICKAGLIELCNSRLRKKDEYVKQKVPFVYSDGRGCYPSLTDVATIIYCSDFHNFTEDFLKIKREGSSTSEYLIRAQDNIFFFMLFPDVGHKLNFPFRIYQRSLNSINDGRRESLGIIQSRYTSAVSFNFFLLVEGVKILASARFSQEKKRWPFPADEIFKKDSDPESPYPLFFLKQTTDRFKCEADEYVLECDLWPFTGTLALSTEPDGPQFGIINASTKRLYLLPWNYQFFNSIPSNAEISKYLKSVPLIYHQPTIIYMNDHGYDIKNIENPLTTQYLNYFIDRRDSLLSIKHEIDMAAVPSNIITIRPPLSSAILRRFYDKHNLGEPKYFETQPMDEVVINDDTADTDIWKSFNDLVFSKKVFKDPWESPAPLSVDRLRELMPLESDTPSIIEDVVEDNISPSVDTEAQDAPATEVSMFRILERLSCYLRDGDIHALEAKLDEIAATSIDNYNFARRFISTAIERFELRASLDPAFLSKL